MTTDNVVPAVADVRSLRSGVERAIRRGCEHLASVQTSAGSWAGDYGGPMFLLPMYVAVAHYAGHEIPADRRARMVRYLRHATNDDGSVGVYEGGPGTVFTTSLAYVALRLLGVEPSDPDVARMRDWLHAHGSPLRAASWAKFTFALIDLYDYEGLDPVTPELWLLPYAVPFHPGRMWCHARQVYLPMAYLYARRAKRPADDTIRAIRRELYTEPYERIAWKRFRGTVAETDSYHPPSAWLRAANGVLGVYERVAPKFLRARAVRETYEHLAFEDEVTNYIRLGPVNAVLNTACHVERDPASAQVRRSFAALEEYFWDGPDGLKMQGYHSSQLWDTALASHSVLATPFAKDFAPMLGRAHGFIRECQIPNDVPDPDAHYRHRSRGGWPFSNRVNGWPTTDCTAEGFKSSIALAPYANQPIDESNLAAAVELMLSFQNDDGGWPSYERQRAGAWFELLNPAQVFGDIMVDYSFTECSSAVIQALAKARGRYGARLDARIDGAIARGARFIRERQRATGGWEGSWGVCFTYGTWFAVSGLLAAGAPANDPAIARACRFLLQRQKPDGSWGEKPDACWERRWVEHPEGQGVMTSWALSTLVRAKCSDAAALDRAARFLVERQSRDGSWPRESWAGVFNRTCMINYDNYRLFFPVWALSEFLAARP